jgi:PAS domain S-box-containing protein
VTPLPTPTHRLRAVEQAPLTTVARLLRERNQLFLLHEALAEIEGARTLSDRLAILETAIKRIGYGRVETHDDFVMPAADQVARRISNSIVLASNDLIVPLRAVGGTALGTLVLGDPLEGTAPTADRVRTVELFAQQVASIIENARLYEESERQRGRGEAFSDIARAVSGSLRLDDVMTLSLGHAMALLHAQGATLSLVRDSQLVVVAGLGVGECLVGAPLPLGSSLSGRAITERRALICNDTSVPEVYAPSRIAANVERALIAPLFSSSGPIGALAVINREKQFTEDDAGVLERLADQVAVAVANARLYEDAKAAAEGYRQAVEDERRARDAVGQSEARYRNLFETATDSIYTVDPQGMFTSVNEATCQLVGRERAELLGRSPLPFVSASDKAMVKEQFKAALLGHARRYHCRFVRPDGVARLASVTNTPIRHGAHVIGILGVARDITEERERDLALERSEIRYTQLVESASDAIFTADTSGNLTAVNRSLEIATGQSRDQLIGRPVFSLIDPRDQVAAKEVLRAGLAGDFPRGDLRYLDGNGELRHCSLTVTPLTEDGVVTGLLGIVRDVTDERRLTEQLMQQEKLAAVGELVSGVAHELNNPLASVMAFAQLLLAAPADTPPDREAIDAINQEARRAAKIVANLLTFARQHQPERTIADLNRVVHDTLELRRYALRTAQVEIDTDLDPDLPLTWADAFQLQQVVLNLLTNAEHALASWDGEKRIAIATKRRGDQLVISVADTGPGVPPENLLRIFNPFFTTKPVGEGTGLGLSISDGIVREHGGRIRVDSRPGLGATFEIELPHAHPPSSTPSDSEEPVAIAPGTKRLLVVDDEAAIRHAVSIFFRSLGHVVDVASNGAEALARARATTYDAMLLDLRLPDTTGDAMLRALHKEGCVPNRVVFVTGDTESETARAVLEATGCEVVGKPFLFDELAAVVLAAEPS